jgi:tetratricopeptide (TPR) repeat protein
VLEYTSQQELSDFLQSELFHTLGAYGVAAQRLRAQNERLAGCARAGLTHELLREAADYNEQLRTLLHRPPRLRDDKSALPRLVGDPTVAPEHTPRHPEGRELTGHEDRLQWIVDFYQSAVDALEALNRHGPAEPWQPSTKDPEALKRVFGARMAVVHDMHRRREVDLTNPTLPQRAPEGRIARYTERLTAVRRVAGRDPSRDHSSALLADHIGQDDPASPHARVVGAFVDAHMLMHRAEHLLSHAFGDAIRFGDHIDDEAVRALRRSLAVNTFVYVAGRSTPWIFAEDEHERDLVIANYEPCCERLMPIYCIWIGQQLSLLALHRRGYAHWLLKEPEQAFSDFYKLKRLIRGLERRLGERTIVAPGARTFLHGLSALAEHHTGRIFRGQTAHRKALRHFDAASQRLERVADDERARAAYRNSRWRVHLLISQAKVHFELGQMARCLLCYLQAWRAFLELADTESLADASFGLVDGVIAWLRDIEPDPDINKEQVRLRFAPLVDQFETFVAPAHLRSIAADIVMRLGHVLFTLQLPDGARRRQPGSRRATDHTIAMRCLNHAAELDCSSTLTAADLLKIGRRLGDAASRSTPSDAFPISAQWPAGGGQFEEAARVIEYVLQRWLEAKPVPHESDTHGQLAEELLTSFLVHTDSSNVKLAQIYLYLMRPSKYHVAAGEGEGPETPLIDVVCARRYSSFFPFLPRPSTFRVLGGGYFVHVRTRDAATPYGIVVDPGPNFLLNLYRCGYCLDDIDMVVVTHDHADHLASLDGLLALLGYRQRLSAGRFGPDRMLAVVGNESVVRRYDFFNEASREWRVWAEQRSSGERSRRDEPSTGFDPVCVLRFGELAAAPFVLKPPRGVHIEAVQTADHCDMACSPAQGFRVRVEEGEARSTVLFTSDTATPAGLQEGAAPPTYTSAGMPFAEALDEADVAIAHVSSVPLRELRELAGLDEAPDGAQSMTREFEELWDLLYSRVHEDGTGPVSNAEFLLRQLRFGFHVRSRSLRTSPLSSTAAMTRPMGSHRHLYLSGLLAIADRMARSDRSRLLLIGELREDLGTFRTRIAATLNNVLFNGRAVRALTADVGLKVRVQKSQVKVLCTTCDLDNDLVDSERYRPLDDIWEVCVKGEDEGVFYNCGYHDPQSQPEPTWLQAVDRYDLFGD